ncbi:MAG: protease modulator HflC, partial [Proteobacteria bacterium]|nr:protease modulator HflC [Pseudomonadota bacterium]
QALLLQLGEPLGVKTKPGLYVKWPFMQNVEMFDKRILDYDVPVEEVITSDRKRLVVDTFARYRIVDPLKFFQSVGTEAVVRNRLGAILNARTREVLGRVPLITVVSGERAGLMSSIAALVNQEARSFGVDVIDVRIKRADLPQENSQAIYLRMQTEREREARGYRAQGAEMAQRIRASAERDRTVILAEAQRDAQFLRGEGDAEAIRIFAEAFNQDPDFFAFYRSMEAYRKSLNKDDTTMVLSPESEFFEFFGNAFGTGRAPGE